MPVKKQMGFYFDQTRCTGCYACVIACKDWYDLSDPAVSCLRIQTIEKGKFPSPFLAHLFVPCYHCENPPCVVVCPAGAIEKRESDGLVVVDGAKCQGKTKCGSLCLGSCPWGAPQFGVESDAKMQKCDFCSDKLERGEKPICIAACPMYALDAGTLDELRARYGDSKSAAGFIYPPGLKPSVVFKAKQE